MESLNNKITLFENRQIRTFWDENSEKWWFSVVDVIAILTESDNPQVYWRVLKKRLADEGNETVTICNGLKMRAPDGKMRKTDMADIEQLLPKMPENRWNSVAERLSVIKMPNKSVGKIYLQKIV